MDNLTAHRIEHFGKTGRHLGCDRLIVPTPHRQENTVRYSLSPNHDYYPPEEAYKWCHTFDEDEPTLEEDTE